MNKKPKKPKCFNCGCAEREMIKVRHNGKKKWICDACYDGFILERREREEGKDKAY